MSPKLPRATGKDTLDALLSAGFIVVRRRGSHNFLSHPEDPTRWATIPVHGKDILPSKTLKSILTSSRLSIEDFIKLKDN
ncbi:MAG: type II toxin-antitoxin system HicA family toxin [Actinobacteria bacterium]|nr:type II toxin-antitoxin system HicA family toxin [Actinomycetota bacterium]